MRRRILISNNGELTLSKNSDNVYASNGSIELHIYKNDIELSSAEYSAVTYTIESSSDNFISSISVYDHPIFGTYMNIAYNENTDLTYGRTAQITFTFNNLSAVYTLTQSKDKLSANVCVRDVNNLILTTESYYFCKNSTTGRTVSGYATGTTGNDYGVHVWLVGQVDIAYSYLYESGNIDGETYVETVPFDINDTIYYCSNTVYMDIYPNVYSKVGVYGGGSISIFDLSSKFYNQVSIGTDYDHIFLEKGRTYSNEIIGYVRLVYRPCNSYDDEVASNFHPIYFDGTVDNSYYTNYTFRI